MRLKAQYAECMSMDAAAVEKALLSLDPHDRAEVLRHGIRSLDADDRTALDQAEVDSAWRTELRRRIDDIESGKVELLDADEVHAQIRAELAARRTWR
jgi:putative addiction module component (TIGR02574 family)